MQTALLKLCVCICTFNRVELLSRLIDDLFRQTILPGTLLIVDGAPETGQVKSVLSRKILYSCKVIYIPSNHANLAYQRYLGWCLVDSSNLLLYLDDDLRIHQLDAVEKTIAPLMWSGRKIAGVTAITTSGDITKFGEEKILIDRARQKFDRPSPLFTLVSRFGSARNISPGGLSPSGHKRAPVQRENAYEETQWLQGRVMAYKLEYLTRECFLDDLFALTHIHCGLGEDTLLSHRVHSKGVLLYAFCAVYEHPDDDLPTSYPIKAFSFGYATSYSRRLLNDHFHGINRPRWLNRVSLVKSYLGTALLKWGHAVTRPRTYRFAYAWGYTLGALRGLIQKPTARNLTPHIDWWQDAEKALSNIVVIQEGGS